MGVDGPESGQRIERFLRIPCEKIGVIGNGSKTPGKRITLGIVNSGYKVEEEISPRSVM